MNEWLTSKWAVESVRQWVTAETMAQTLKRISNTHNFSGAENRREGQIMPLSKRYGKRQSPQEGRGETDGETQRRGVREQIKEEWWRAYLQAATRGITVMVSVTPFSCHPSFSLYLFPLFCFVTTQMLLSGRSVFPRKCTSGTAIVCVHVWVCVWICERIGRREREWKGKKCWDNPVKLSVYKCTFMIK